MKMSNIQNLTASLDLKQNLNIYANCKQFDNLNLILLFMTIVYKLI